MKDQEKRIIILSASFQSPSTFCISHPLSTTKARSPAYNNLPGIPLKLTFLITGSRALPCLKPMFTLSSLNILGPTKTLPFVPCFRHSHLSHCRHHHLSRDIVVGLRQDHKSQCCFTVQLQPLLHQLSLQGHPSIIHLPFLNPCCSSPISISTLCYRIQNPLQHLHDTTKECNAPVLPRFLTIAFLLPYTHN